MPDPNLSGYVSLGDDINKRPTDGSDETRQGVVSVKQSELTLDMKNEDIIALTEKWKKAWDDSPKKAEWEKKYAENEKYWLGEQFDMPKVDKSRPMVDNLMFESVETFLPQATRRNPEPLVTVDASEADIDGNIKKEYTAYAAKVKNRLADIADKNTLRLKLKKATRHWAIYMLGVAKLAWNVEKKMPMVQIIRPQKIVLDPDATTDEDGYSGDRVGEIRKLTADKILTIIKGSDTYIEAEKAIKALVKEDLGTEVQFMEWWTSTYMCWTFGKTVLWKKKNPHWNYDRTETPQATELASEGVQVDDYGNTTVQPIEVEGINHFETPRLPYEFLSIFNLGDQPVDKTSLMTQNLSNQDKINKRNKQIDKNTDGMNGGIVVSLERTGLSQTQASGVAKALEKGGIVAVPTGPAGEGVARVSAPGLPPDVYNDLVDTRARMRDIFGVKGSSQAGLQTEDTVRGKILSKGLDTDRIGGGITEFIEQFGDRIYNWYTQLLYVYSDAFQFIEGARPPLIIVSVKEGSLLPKDSSSLATQALELAKMNKISNLDLYKQLEYPNPEEMAANAWLEVNAPQILYKDNPMVQEVLAMQSAAAAVETEKDQQKGEQEHQRGIEKEIVKGAVKEEQGVGKPGGSILSRIPTSPLEAIT